MRAAGVLAAVAAVACGGRGAPAPGATSGAPAPIDNVATDPAPPARCGTTRACIDACDAGDAAACGRAHRFAFAFLDYEGDPSLEDPYEEAIGYAARGCELGDLPSCAEASQFTDDGADDRARRACDAGIARGCHVWGRRQSDGELIVRAGELYRQACDAGDGEACMQLVGMYGGYAGFFGQGPAELGADPDQVVRYLRAAIAAFEAGCAAGDPLACLDRVWVYQHDQLGPQTPHPKEWVDRACALVGAAPGCWHGDQPIIHDVHGYVIEDRL